MIDLISLPQNEGRRQEQVLVRFTQSFAQTAHFDLILSGNWACVDE
ncbi:MAG: hypothetical protein JJU29_08440 [Verrucomicrobia bacterium]|nr:hypothetical protein [Verrucomicrobiota bacterium]MCH8512120.1 hypothetical protein [Kiritimatiellia bacterium]